MAACVVLACTAGSSEAQRSTSGALQAAFESEYARYAEVLTDREMNAWGVYHLRRGLQALVDMWRATAEPVYLERAHALTRQAIQAARQNPKILRRGGVRYGSWPCFYHPGVDDATGGHNQHSDFQAATGFLIVAAALREAGNPAWREIPDFVESTIVDKWIRFGGLGAEPLAGAQGARRIVGALASARDNRELFANVCLDLSEMGYTSYPYAQWAQYLVDMYLGRRRSMSEPFWDNGLGPLLPQDWGLVPVPETGGLKWYWSPEKIMRVQDTSHANRTVWLAVRAHSRGQLQAGLLEALIDTFKEQIWAREIGQFAFNNYVDGSNDPVGELRPGWAGNIWFGWHRLAAYDSELGDLYVALANELAEGGSRIPMSQNKSMIEARLCLIAWGARLQSHSGQPLRFP